MSDPEDALGPERIADVETTEAEEEVERSLRPRTLQEFVGQESARRQLSIFLEAAKQRAEALDHVLLAGPPGLGKTTLAAIVATEHGVGFHVTSVPV